MTTKGKRNALSAVFVQSVQEMGTYSDGGGLNLRVEDSGTKYWFQLVTIDGKPRNLGLGGGTQGSSGQRQDDPGRPRPAGGETRGHCSRPATTHADVC